VAFALATTNLRGDDILITDFKDCIFGMNNKDERMQVCRIFMKVAAAHNAMLRTPEVLKKHYQTKI
jgi:hypothetical protein